MVDVHKHVKTLMDPISVPAGMVISCTVIIIHVLVYTVSQSNIPYSRKFSEGEIFGNFGKKQ